MLTPGTLASRFLTPRCRQIGPREWREERWERREAREGRWREGSWSKGERKEGRREKEQDEGGWWRDEQKTR